MKSTKKNKKKLRPNPLKIEDLTRSALKLLNDEVIIKERFGMFGVLLSYGSPKLKEFMVNLEIKKDHEGKKDANPNM